MIDSAAARRYAEAFVNAMEAQPKLEQGLADLKSAAQIYEDSKPLQRFLGSPEIAEEDKRRLLDRLLEGFVEGKVLNLLHLLLRKERFDHLNVISQEALNLAETRRGILRGRLVTAHPISSAEIENISRAVSQLLNKQVILERQVDAQVIGGMKVMIGTTLLDATVQTAIQSVRRNLLTAKVN